MCDPGVIVDKVDKYLIDPVVRRIKILKNCSNNVENLRDKVGELKANSSDRRRKSDKEKIAGQVDTETARNWFNVVGEIEAEATAIQEGYDRGRCAGGSCVNCWSHYKLSKRSPLLMVKAIEKLNQEFDLTMQPPPVPVIEIESEPTDNQPSTQAMLRQLLDHLSDPNIGIIGIHGMGGVGKTTLVEKVNNHFIEKENESSPFNTVIMVTVSATPDIPSIQNKISDHLDLDLSKYNEDDARKKLLHALRQKKFLLILDDVWSKLELNGVGIPHPRPNKGSKILITSRKRDTCTHMDADIKMKVQRLSRDESWNLFVEKAGQHVTNHPIKQFAETIVGKCEGLPLAIVTVARAMADRDGRREWADAVRQMEQPATNFLGMKDKVFDLLRFSFDRLRDDMVRSLFLYLACFPEDYDIGENEMLNFCVGEGLVDNFNSLAAAMNRGEFLIGSLKIASMLEDGEDERTVKMHDMMRELVLWITSSKSDGNPKFLIRTGNSLQAAPHPNEWVEATRVSLINTEIDELPQLGEKCQNLTTLLLRGNKILNFSQIDFLQHMNHLSILDLSGSDKLCHLPDSLSSLVNLRVLRCRKCLKLRALPALGVLQHLQVLDLFGCSELDQQILTSECLGGAPSNLRYLDVGNTKVSIPTGAISSLLKLVEVMNFFWARNIQWRVRSENEKRGGSGSDDPSSSSKGKRVEGNNIIDVEELSHLTHLTSLSICFKNISISDWFQPLAKLMNKVELNSCTAINQDAIQALKESQNLQVLEFWNCPGLTSVPTRIEEKLLISGCTDLEKLLDGAEADQYSFQKIKLLHLIGLRKLKTLCIGPAPLNCFGQLKRFELFSCDLLTMVFTKGMPRHFNNLSYLNINSCSKIEVIIEAAEKEDGQVDERSYNDNGVISPFPKLRKLVLRYLESLTDGCRGHLLDCPLLEDVEVIACPKLNNFLHKHNAE